MAVFACEQSRDTFMNAYEKFLALRLLNMDKSAILFEAETSLY